MGRFDKLARLRLGADRLVARAPSIPFGYAVWGEARLDRGEARRR